MSSVSASDRSRQTDEVRRVKEDAESKETQKAKKQKAELQRLQQKYSEQVKDLEESYDGRVDSLRKQNKEALTERDNNHQEQIDKIRDLYQEQLTRKSEDNDTNRNTQRTTYKSEIEKQKAIQEQQTDNLVKSHRDEMREKDREVEEYSVRARDEIRNSIADRTKKLNSKHEQELDATVKDRDNTKAKLSQEIANQSSTYKAESKERERQHRHETDRINESWRGTLNEKEELNGSILRNRDILLQAEKEDLREKYRNRIDEKTEQMDKVRNDLQDEAETRHSREINSAKTSISAARSQAVQDNLTNERLRKMEKQNIVRSYEARQGDLERQTQELKATSNDLTHKRVNMVLEKGDKVLQQAVMKSKMDQQLANTRHQEDRDNILTTTQIALDEKDKKTDQRIKRTLAVTAQTTQDQDQLHNKNLSDIKETYYEQLGNQRSAHIESLNDIRGSMEARLRENQVKSQKKIENLTDFYENKIKTMEEQHKESMVRLRKAFEDRSNQQEKAHTIDDKQISQKYEIKFDAQQAETQKELDRLQKKHEMDMANLAARVTLKKKG